MKEVVRSTLKGFYMSRCGNAFCIEEVNLDLSFRKHSPRELAIIALDEWEKAFPELELVSHTVESSEARVHITIVSKPKKVADQLVPA